MAELVDVRLAFCDRSPSKAQAFGARLGSTRLYADLDDMLAMEQLHVAHVLTRSTRT